MRKDRANKLVTLGGDKLENIAYVIQIDRETVRYRYRRTGKHRGGLRVDIGDESRVRGNPLAIYAS